MKKIVQKLENRDKSSANLTRDSLLFKVILDAVLTKNGQNVNSLDLRDIEESITDFYIICDVETNTEMRAIANFVEKQVRDLCHEKPFALEESEEWVLLDYVNVVLHIFKPEERAFYDLEGMWSDSGKMSHN